VRVLLSTDVCGTVFELMVSSGISTRRCTAAASPSSTRPSCRCSSTGAPIEHQLLPPFEA
jgi:hypothetical protein